MVAASATAPVHAARMGDAVAARGAISRERAFDVSADYALRLVVEYGELPAEDAGARDELPEALFGGKGVVPFEGGRLHVGDRRMPQSIARVGAVEPFERRHEVRRNARTKRID